MSKKLTFRGHSTQTYAEVFQSFISAKTAQGVADIIIRNYHNNLHVISKYLDTNLSLGQLTKRDLEEMIVAMRREGLAHNSISTYVRIVRTFLNWCSAEGLTSLTIPNMKDKDTVKETYTDDELMFLLRRPERDCDFTEYRNWVIVNFLLNSGCRAATVRNIQNRDVDLDARQITLRHNKNGKIQVIPLCGVMVAILREYIIPKGKRKGTFSFTVLNFLNSRDTISPPNKSK